MTDLLETGLLVFGAIFAFEIVDRTNFAVIALSAKHRHTHVWMGAASAFVVSTAISVAIGYVVVSYLLAYLPWVKIVGGAILAAFGVRALLRLEGPEAEKAEREAEASLSRREVWSVAFTLILFLEMGDNTQVLTILFVASLGNWVLVFVAAVLALVSVAAIGATSGNYLKARISPDRLERLLGAILIVVGAVTMLLGVLQLLKVPLPSWV